MKGVFNKIKRGELGEEELPKYILNRYIDVCGNYGRGIFENKILPRAIEIFKGEPFAFALGMYRVIELASRSTKSKIEDYLLEVDSKFSVPDINLMNLINNI